MSSYTFADALREQRHKVGLSQRELGERSGVNYVTIANIEAGKTKRCTADTRAKLEAVLGPIEFSPSVNEGATATALRRSSHQNRRVLLVGRIPAGDPRVVDVGEGQMVDVPEQLLPSGEVCAVIVQGVSMHPSFEPGDVVILGRAEWREVKNRQICAVTLESGETTLKEIQFRRGEAGPEVWLIPHNTEERDFKGERMFQDTRIDPDTCKVEGVAVGLMRKLI